MIFKNILEFLLMLANTCVVSLYVKKKQYQIIYDSNYVKYNFHNKN